MERFNRFVAKYVWIVYWAWVICLVVLWGVSVWLGMSQVVATFLLVGFVWLGARWIFTRDQALRRAQVACMFNQCDPYPFLEEAKRQLLYQGTKPMKLTRLIDYSTALLEVGEVELPWVLAEDWEDVISPANEPEFLEKMYRKLIRRNGISGPFCSWS